MANSSGRQPFKRRIAGFLIPLVLCLVSGCQSWDQYVHNGFKVGPNYSPPCAPVAKQWIDADDPAVVSRGPDRDAWWTLFNDPILNDLIVEARYENLSLRAACWRIQEARARRGIAVGELFPQQQQLAGSYARKEVSENVPNQSAQPRFFDLWEYGLNLSWELDFWGRYRRAVEAASAELDASVAGYQNVLVLLQSDVAFAYVQIRTFDMRLQAARENLALQESSLKIVQQRFSKGVTTELDVAQATVNVEQTRARIRSLEIERRQTANQLCTLLGVPPQELDGVLGATQSIPTAPPQVAIGVPAQLLNRRPDVRQMERQLAAQAARIGIAESELYPHIAINGNIGFESSEFSQLFDTRSVAGSIGPSFRWNILNYGRIVNSIHVEDARFQNLLYRYQDTVLTANREAEDALVAFLRSQLRLKDLLASAKASQRSVDLALQQYQAGLTDFNRVYTLEQALSSSQEQVAQGQGDVPLNLILLYKALGGGWRVCTEELTSQAMATDEPSSVPPAPEAIPKPIPAPGTGREGGSVPKANHSSAAAKSMQPKSSEQGQQGPGSGQLGTYSGPRLSGSVQAGAM